MVISAPSHLVSQIILKGEAADHPELIDVTIDPTAAIKNLQLTVCHTSTKVWIGSNVSAEIITAKMIFPGPLLRIGNNSLINNFCVSFPEANLSLTIGEGCLISHGVTFRPSDHHPIFSLDTDELINPGRSILIGNKVWIAEQVSILKGSVIGDGAVIGAKSTVTGHVPANCISVGNPAKVIREGIYWKLK